MHRRAWQKQLDQAGASTSSGTTSPDPVLSAVRRENEVLTEERDLYRKKHFVTAVALKGSQLQVGKRDMEAAGLVGTIARTVSFVRYPLSVFAADNVVAPARSLSVSVFSSAYVYMC